MSSTFLLASRFCQELCKYKKYLEMRKFEFESSSAVVFRVNAYPKKCTGRFIGNIRTSILIYFYLKNVRKKLSFSNTECTYRCWHPHSTPGPEGSVLWTAGKVSRGKGRGAPHCRAAGSGALTHSFILLQCIVMRCSLWEPGCVDLWILLFSFN